MKYTFYTTGLNGQKMYPRAFSDYPMDSPIGQWTTEVDSAISWDDKQACELIMSYYGGTELVELKE